MPRRALEGAAAEHGIKIKAQLFCAGNIAFGPGKAALLDAIARDGSISAAARAMGMSYRRAWLLVDMMNQCWQQPLVITTVGGRKGASLTSYGTEILEAYRALEGELALVARGHNARVLVAGIKTLR